MYIPDADSSVISINIRKVGQITALQSAEVQRVQFAAHASRVCAASYACQPLDAYHIFQRSSSHFYHTDPKMHCGGGGRQVSNMHGLPLTKLGSVIGCLVFPALS
jgi:hypothetical protein